MTTKSAFFSDDITELSQPDYANVRCRNILNGRYCYAFQNEKGQLFTGYQFDKDDFSIELTPASDWAVLPL